MYKLIILSAVMVACLAAPAPAPHGIVYSAPVAVAPAVYAPAVTSYSAHSSHIVHPSPIVAAPIVHSVPVAHSLPLVHSVHPGYSHGVVLV